MRSTAEMYRRGLPVKAFLVMQYLQGFLFVKVYTKTYGG